MKIICAAIFLLASFAGAAVTSFAVVPSATDPEIKTFDDPHWIYVNRDIVVEHKADLPKDRQELLLWLPGTHGKGHGAQGFANLAADLGYHVIALMYPDGVAASVCAHDPNPKGFEQFRMAILRGGSASDQDGETEISVARPESIENRLIKLLQYLQKNRPEENWGQFLNHENAIKWSVIAVAGQSQGGGHAALIGVMHKVARVICFGAPKDFNQALDSPAAWYSNPSATPKNRFFAFNHHQDPNTCTPQQLLQNQKALGMDAFGPPAEVNTDHPPFHHARMLYTSYPALKISSNESPEAKMAHTAAISTKNAARWKPVWTYLLTEKTE